VSEAPWDEGEGLALLTRVVRTADQDFQSVGGGTRHWVRDCLLPRLEQAGLTIARLEQGATGGGAAAASLPADQCAALIEAAKEQLRRQGRAEINDPSLRAALVWLERQP
jgi:hypothetical protein